MGFDQLNNPTFNCAEFGIIKSQAGLNNYKISVKEWAEKTNAIGLKATAGRYGGTYAHKDIAFEFGSWLSPVHTDAVRDYIIPKIDIERDKSYAYADEADMLNLFTRYTYLKETAKQQLSRLNTIDAEKGFRKLKSEKLIK